MANVQRPEFNRLIKCSGHDFTPFTCVGMWKTVRARKNKTKAGFYIKDHQGFFNRDMDTWYDIESWEYIDKEKTD